MNNPLEFGEPKARYDLLEDGRWLAVIYRENEIGKKLVLTIGVESNRKDIKKWINNYMLHRCWEHDNEAELAPDMHDRARKLFH